MAKADPDTTFGTLQAMLRALLIQRFHLAVHEEQQPVQVYALSAPKGPHPRRPRQQLRGRWQ